MDQAALSNRFRSNDDVLSVGGNGTILIGFRRSSSLAEWVGELHSKQDKHPAGSTTLCQQRTVGGLFVATGTVTLGSAGQAGPR